MQKGEGFIMDAKIKKIILIMLMIILVICIWTMMKPQIYEPRKELIDTSIMGEEVPIKIITLNRTMTSRENYEIAYLLGDNGNLYVLCNDTEKYYVDLWQPEFWKNIGIVDICAERPWSYAAALDKEGNVYVWKKEYLSGESGETEIETKKREDWKIQKLGNIPKVSEIYATHDQFVIVTEEENICIWSPEDNVNPDMDDMEMIEMEIPILNIAASEEAVFILDDNHTLWSIENGMKNFLKENVKSIMQGYKGLAIQMIDSENEIYICNISLLQQGYETVIFADKYEAAKIVFEDKISSISANGWIAVACTDKQEFYRWGKEKNPQYWYVAVPSMRVYAEPVKIDLADAKYYMVIGECIVYIDERNEVFVLI